MQVMEGAGSSLGASLLLLFVRDLTIWGYLNVCVLSVILYFELSDRFWC